MKTNEPKVPEFLKGSNVDANGLPLRMAIQGQRRLDEPYRSKGIRLRWNLRDGVVIEPGSTGRE
jgi:hypothetical protein